MSWRTAPCLIALVIFAITGSGCTSESAEKVPNSTAPAPTAASTTTSASPRTRPEPATESSTAFAGTPAKKIATATAKAKLPFRCPSDSQASRLIGSTLVQVKAQEPIPGDHSCYFFTSKSGSFAAPAMSVSEIPGTLEEFTNDKRIVPSSSGATTSVTVVHIGKDPVVSGATYFYFEFVGSYPLESTCSIAIPSNRAGYLTVFIVSLQTKSESSACGIARKLALANY